MADLGAVVALAAPRPLAVGAVVPPLAALLSPSAVVTAGLSAGVFVPGRVLLLFETW